MVGCSKCGERFSEAAHQNKSFEGGAGRRLHDHSVDALLLGIGKQR